MRGRLVVVMAVAVWGAARGAVAGAAGGKRGGEPPESVAADRAAAAIDEIEIVFDEHRYSAVLRLARAAVAEFPDEGLAHYYLGVTLGITLQLEEAEAELRRATVLLPEFAGAHAQLGVVRALREDTAWARAAYERALALDPEDELASMGLEEIALVERIEGWKAPRFDGSPPAVVVAFAKMVEKGDLLGAVEKYMDVEYLFEQLEKTGLEGERRELLDGLAKGVRKGFLEEGGRAAFDGWMVESEWREESGEAEVDAFVMWHSLGSENPEALKKYLTSADWEEYIGDDARAVYLGLEEPDRDAYLERLSRDRSRTFVPVTFDLERAAHDRWRIKDIAWGEPGTFFMRLSDMIVNIERFARLAAEDGDGEDDDGEDDDVSPRLSPEALLVAKVVTLLIALAVGGAVAFLASRRKSPSRGAGAAAPASLALSPGTPDAPPAAADLGAAGEAPAPPAAPAESPSVDESPPDVKASG